jgi:hypothetical protein
MSGAENKRKSKRKDCLYEIKVRFPEQDNDTSLAVKNISGSGMRVIIARLVKIGDSLEIKMCINGRDMQCKGRVVYVLLLRPVLGDIRSFDVGVEFCEMDTKDREFLEKLAE